MKNSITSVIVVIIFVSILSSLGLGFGVSTGLISFNIGSEDVLESESLIIRNCTSSADVLKLTVQNTGLKDVKLEYIVVDGNVTIYGSKMFDLMTQYNYAKGEYLIIPSNSHVEIYVPSHSNKETVEIRLHTVKGSDFKKVLIPTETSSDNGEGVSQEKVAIDTITVNNASLGQIELKCKSLSDNDVIIEDAILRDSSGHAIEVLSLSTPVTLPRSGNMTDIDCDFATALIKENIYSIVLVSKNNNQFVSNPFKV